MKKIIADPLLMIATILIIVGFQVYWLKNNYDREQRLLNSKAGIVFRTTLFELQAKKLKLNLNGGKGDRHANIKVVFNNSEEEQPVYVRNAPEEQLVEISNAVRKQLQDSVKKDTGVKNNMLVNVNKSSFLYHRDSVKGNIITEDIKGDDKIFQVLYGIDSLQDSLKLNEIIAAVKKSFVEEKLTIPFSISCNDTTKINDDNFIPGRVGKTDLENMDQVTVGFAHPITYQLQLGNTFSYLFKKILSPLLFSVFLIAVTIFSFLLLYRNLLRQRKLTEIKNEFIGNITHELKTPISTVSVAIEAIRNFNALQNPARTQEYLDIANNELQRLGLLVDKVLKLSMFENREIHLNKEKVDLRQLAEEVMASMKPQFEKSNAIVTFKTSGENFIIEADKMHITSVIYNLLDNALKYSKADPQIAVQIIDQSKYIELRVADNGIGIAPEYKTKIFEKFFRVPDGNRHNIKGYGLGLSYVFHIAVRHMGFAEVESELGKGSTFIVKLPFAEASVINYDKGRKVIWKGFKIGKP